MKRTFISLITLLAAILALVYAFRRRLIGWWLDLPPGQYNLTVTRNVPIPMPDGVILRADHYQPKPAGLYPTILIRTPYGRGLEAMALNFVFYAYCFAQHGYHVVIQGGRGRFDSEGEFTAFVDEAADGQATVDWLATQPWFNGEVGLWGPSYLGYVQWAIAIQGSPHVKALLPSVTFSQPFTVIHADGALALDTLLREIVTFEAMGNDGVGLHSWLGHISLARQARKLSAAFNHLPLLEADTLVRGQPDPEYRQGIIHLDPTDPYWQRVDYSADLGQITAPTLFVSGWYDLFLRETLRDYTTLKRAGRTPYLVIGPWIHMEPNRARESLRSGLIWFDTCLKGAAHPSATSHRLQKKPVKLYVMGAKAWRELDSWQPSNTETAWFLQPQGRLSAQPPPPNAPPDQYQYNPADPTPALGGPLLLPPCGPMDNRPLEVRPDVLTYTTPPLPQAVEIMGTARLTLYVHSTLAHTDFFGRLCDVQPNGRSLNICDGLLRLTPDQGQRQADGSRLIEIKLWPTAYHFQPGHRLRLQLSSGAHPRWSRNLGTGEPVATGTKMLIADQTIYHDEQHPSTLWLPVPVGE